MLATCAVSALGVTTAAAAQVPEQSTEPTEAAKSEQAAPSTDADNANQDGGEVIVTGTLVRGVAPTGTNVVSVSKQT